MIPTLPHLFFNLSHWEKNGEMTLFVSWWHSSDTSNSSQKYNFAGLKINSSSPFSVVITLIEFCCFESQIVCVPSSSFVDHLTTSKIDEYLAPAIATISALKFFEKIWLLPTYAVIVNQGWNHLEMKVSIQAYFYLIKQKSLLANEPSFTR